MGDVIGFDRFLSERDKKLNPKAYNDRKAFEALERQHAKQLALPKPVEVIDREWDEEAGCEVLTYHANRDPGDEV